MMRGLLVSSLSLSLSFGSTALAANRCAGIFASSNMTSINIEASIKSLAQFRLDLDLLLAQGQSLSPHQTALRANYVSKEKELLNYLTLHGLMTKAELHDKIKKQILVLQETQKKSLVQKLNEKEKRETETKAHDLEIRRAYYTEFSTRLHEIQPGSFIMGAKTSNAINVTLTKPFALAATPTTQILWRTVLELYAKNFGEPPVTLKKDPSSFKGDKRPVENITHSQTLEWLEILNILSAMADPQLLHDLLPGHKQGDVYRLPTEAEWEYVVTGRGTQTSRYHFGNWVKDLDDYGWHQDNSNNQTHPVGEKLPLVVDGKEFFDMYGNVFEWVADGESLTLPGGTDPLVLSGSMSKHMTRGSSFSGSVIHVKSTARDSLYWPRDSLGFRLVREVRP